MAKRYTLHDDLDDAAADAAGKPVLTRYFSFGKTAKTVRHFEIDLHDASFAELEKALARFVKAGRKQEPSSAPSAPVAASDGATDATTDARSPRLTGEAAKAYAAATREHTEGKRKQRAAMQAWAPNAPEELPGKAPGSRGQVDAAFAAAFYAAYPEAVRFFGADAVPAPQRDDFRSQDAS